MAIGRNRARVRSNRLGGRRTRGTGVRAGGLDTSAIPRALVGAVNGIEVVAVGALRISRDVVLRAVAGAADIGTEAVTATTAGVRGVVSAASRMVGDIAGAAQATLRETLYDVTHARRGAARPLGEMPRAVGDSREATTSRPGGDSTTAAPHGPTACRLPAAASERGRLIVSFRAPVVFCPVQRDRVPST